VQREITMRKEGSKQTHKTEEKNVMPIVKRIRCGAEETVTRRSCLGPRKFFTTKSCLGHFRSNTLCPQHKRKPNVHMGR